MAEHDPIPARLEVLAVTLQQAVKDITSVTAELKSDYLRTAVYKEIKASQDLQFAALRADNTRTQADVDTLAKAREDDKREAEKERKEWARTRSTNNVALLIFGAGTMVSVVMNVIALLRK